MDTYIDIYCERLEPGLWAEPINALTNASFFIAAFFAYRLVRTMDDPPLSAWLLTALILCMGIGSTLFHTFATLWAMFSDIIPILLFQLSFIFFYARDIMKLSLFKRIGLFVAFFISMAFFMQLPREWLNGSLEYAPAYLFLAGFALWHYVTNQAERYVLFFSTLTFTMSLAFRSLDMAVCDHMAIGTHFLWHVLNGLVLYLAARGYIKAYRAV